MIITFDVEPAIVDEVRTSLERYSPKRGPELDNLIEAYLVYAARAGISFEIEETGIDASVDLFVRQ